MANSFFSCIPAFLSGLSFRRATFKFPGASIDARAVFQREGWVLARSQAYLEKLEGFSTEELDRSAGELALREKEHMAQVIAHVAARARWP